MAKKKSAERKSTKGKKQVDIETFVRAWETHIAKSKLEGYKGNPADNIADELGLTKSSVIQRASKIRNKDKIPLTPIPRTATAGKSRESKVEEVRENFTSLLDEIKRQVAREAKS